MNGVLSRSERRHFRRPQMSDGGFCCLPGAIFDVPAGSYTIKGIGDEPQNVIVSPGQTVGLKLIVH